MNTLLLPPPPLCLGKHHILMEVQGTGLIAQLLRAIFKGMNVTHEIDNYTSTGGRQACPLFCTVRAFTSNLPAFSHAGPATWNALPDHIRTVPDPGKFRKLLLKSHCFSQAFNIDFCVFLGVLAFG